MREKKGRRWMRFLIGICTVAVLFASVYLVGTGLMKRTDVFVGEYLLSDSGEMMTVRAGVAGSMGYIRDISVKQKEDTLYLTFYATFGGLNSSLGARSEFSFPVNGGIKEICVYRGNGEFEAILRMNPDTERWERVD